MCIFVVFKNMYREVVFLMFNKRKEKVDKMNFIKKNYKLIIGIIIGAILISGISVYATGQYLASQVTYNNTNVANALNDLYNKIKDINETDSISTDILSGKKAYTKNGLITGTKSIDCISGTYSKPANTYISIDIGFTPTKYILQWELADGTIITTFYDSSISNSIYKTDTNNINEDFTQVFGIIDNKIIDKSNQSNSFRYKQALTVHYMASK